MFDNFHTYKGDRKKANRGVFKLLRLKSNRVLRKYKVRAKRIQRCSKCKSRKHNASSRKCPANVDLTDMIDDTSEDEIVESTDDTADEETADDEEFSDTNIDDLLDSDEDLF